MKTATQTMATRITEYLKDRDWSGLADMRAVLKVSHDNDGSGLLQNVKRLVRAGVLEQRGGEVGQFQVRIKSSPPVSAGTTNNARGRGET